MRVKYNVDTHLIFQIGDPVDHATAPFLHNAMYGLANVNAICTPVFVPRGHLPEFIQAVKTIGASGFDITMPHKSDIIPLLDECDEASRVFNCVNHVKLVDGKLIGIGLDGVGMGLAIADVTSTLEGKSVLILGAGAVSGPIAADLCSRGCTRVTVANRTVEKAEHVAKTLESVYHIDTASGPLTEEFLEKAAAEADIVVQCTSLGMMGSNQNYESLAFMDKLRPGTVCADVLYPTSAFLQRAEALGMTTVSGLGMLLNQQIAMIDFRFGIKLPQECLKIAEESLVCAVALRDLRDKRIASENHAKEHH